MKHKVDGIAAAVRTAVSQSLSTKILPPPDENALKHFEMGIQNGVCLMVDHLARMLAAQGRGFNLERFVISCGLRLVGGAIVFPDDALPTLARK